MIEIEPYQIFDSILMMAKSEYKFSPSSDLVRIREPYQFGLIKKSEYTLSKEKEIIQQKQYKSSGNIDSTHWSILSKEENKSYTINRYFLQLNLKVKVDSTCYDVVLLLKVHIIECSNAERDYFAILKEESVSTMGIKNVTNKQRKIDQLDDILMTNYLEVYQLQQDNQLQFQGNLTTEILRILTKDNTFNLEIVDFKFHINTQITILNQQGQFLSLRYNIQSKEWMLDQYILTEIDKHYAYDYVFDTNNNLTHKQAIISDTILYYKFISDGDKSWTIRDLKNDINSKVYISFSYILLQNQKSLSLYEYYSNQIGQLVQSINLEAQTFVHQYPNFASFLLFIKPYFYAYNYDPKGLTFQFQSKELINEHVHFTLEKNK
ncbi:unnamed protein product [Paramecium sonneborni]|uniref:Uncharacterized protein n=1 Tax=Paramecium sonneborni TaxID=65129 RepID=A0A8S1LCE7_9CILI|nr:unnamed protein product [Paramecium sonneborni]